MKKPSRRDKIDFILSAMSADAIKIWDVDEPSTIRFMRYAHDLIQTEEGVRWAGERRELIQKAQHAHQRLYNLAQEMCGRDKVKKRVFVTQMETLWTESPERIYIGSDEFMSGFKAGVILDESGVFTLSDFGWSTNRGLRNFTANVEQFIRQQTPKKK